MNNNQNANTELKLYDKVSYAGREWYIIKEEGNLVHLLLAHAELPVQQARIGQYTAAPTYYKRSRAYYNLIEDALPAILLDGGNPIQVTVDDSYTTHCFTQNHTKEFSEARIYQLKCWEAARLPEHIRKFETDWWLRGLLVCYCDKDGNTVGEYDFGGSGSHSASCRPVICIDRAELLPAPKKIEAGSTVAYGGSVWTVIKTNRGIATLLLAHYMGDEKPFDSRDRNEYKKSSIRKYLRQTLLPAIQKKGAKPIDTKLPDAGCSDRLFLLSAEEAEQLPEHVRDFGQQRLWWTRTPHESKDGVCAKTGGGDCRNVGWSSVAVRPAMRVKISDLH